ncbi:MAG: glutamine-hydrolyzing GMP synthase, partial [Planctomycetota bacterium]
MARPDQPGSMTQHEEVVPILDFGSQTAQLIARRVREAGVYAVLVDPATRAEKLKAMAPKGIILSGGPASVYDENAPTMDPEVLSIGVPVLGICYGMQLACRMLGAEVRPNSKREFGRAPMTRGPEPSSFLQAIPEKTSVWMSHGDQIESLAEAGFKTIASTPTCPHAAVERRAGDAVFLGVQFHPEVTHTPHGRDMLQNFLYEICGYAGSWRMADFATTAAETLRASIGDAHVICGLSGGVDSSVAAALLHRAIGDRLHCVFVDNGLLRKNERALVETTFRDHFKIDLRVVDASEAFLSDLAGVTDPQRKRKLIGARFVDVFRDAAKDIGGATHLAQGTLYPDV